MYYLWNIYLNALLWTSVDLLLLHLVLAEVTEDYLPPQIKVHPNRKIIFKDHDQIKLDCEATAMPTAKYYWKKNGRKLDLSNEFINILSPLKGTIMISIAVPADEGYYQCFAENPYGTSMSRVAEVRKAVLDHSPEHHSSLTVYEIIRGLPFKAPCVHIESYPPSWYSWEIVPTYNDPLVKGTPLALDNRMQIDDAGSLYFSHMKLSDHQGGSYYRCMVHNVFLGRNISGNYIKMTVTQGDKQIRAPTLAYSNPAVGEPVIGLVNESVSLQCIFNGFPTPTVQWVKENGILPRSRYRLLNSDTTLVIDDVKFDDIGTYKCIGTVRQHEVVFNKEIQLKLEVHSKPRFKSEHSRPKNEILAVGSTALFVCDVTGYPKPQVHWFINGISINDFSNPRIGVGHNHTILTIQKLCIRCDDDTSDIGVVQCNASNIHGYVYAEGYLKVTGPLTQYDNKSDLVTDPEVLPTQSPHHVKTGLIVGISIAVVISGISVIAIIMFFYCRSKQLERELTTLRMTMKKRPHSNGRQHQISNNPSSNRTTLYEHIGEQYEKLNRNTESPTENDNHTGQLNPGPYQQLQIPDRNAINLIDDTYKYDYAYEGTEESTNELLGNGMEKDYVPHSPVVSAYIEIIDTEDMEKG